MNVTASSPDSPAIEATAPALATDSVAAAPSPKRRLPMTLGVGILAVIAVVAALYLARAFFVPLLIGILASYALRPLVNWLKACYIPRPAGAVRVASPPLVRAWRPPFSSLRPWRSAGLTFRVLTC